MFMIDIRGMVIKELKASTAVAMPKYCVLIFVAYKK